MSFLFFFYRKECKILNLSKLSLCIEYVCSLLYFYWEISLNSFFHCRTGPKTRFSCWDASHVMCLWHQLPSGSHPSPGLQLVWIWNFPSLSFSLILIINFYICLICDFNHFSDQTSPQLARIPSLSTTSRVWYKVNF